MLKLIADERQLTARMTTRLTTDSVGLVARLCLSEDFDGLAVTVCFKAGDVAADVPILDGTEITVPSQCFAAEGEVLYAGVYASNAEGTIVIPTVWAQCGTIRRGTVPSGVDPQGPEPDWTARVLSAAADAVATAQSVRDDADAGAFDGYSPTATVTQLEDGATIRITDKDGTTTATVHDGQTGPEGPDGFSPTATVTQTATGATVTITDQSGTTTADISNGAPGEQGATGPQGPAGVSPTASVQRVEGGAEVTVTDATGTTTAMLYDATIAAGSVTDAMLAPDGIKPQVAQLFGNQLAGTLSGNIATASDVYAVPPMALSVDGNSTQDGTPTPNAPVPIDSVVNPALTFAGRNLFDPSLFESFPQVTYDDDVWTIAAPLSAMDNKTIWRNTGLSGTGYIWYQVKDATGTLAGLRIYIRYKDGSNVRLGNSVAVLDWTAYGSGYIDLATVDYLYTSYDASHVTKFRGLQIVLDSTLHEYVPYQGATVPIYDVTLRSLPDGTRDTLHLSYLRPSTRAGWAWYERSVARLVGNVTLDGTAAIGRRLPTPPATATRGYTYLPDGASAITAAIRSNFRSDMFHYDADTILTADKQVSGMAALYQYSGNPAFLFCIEGELTTEEINTWLAENMPTLDYKLATPVITALDPIELPELPAPNATVWCDPTTGLQMEYVQDTSIVIAELRAALADLATS